MDDEWIRKFTEDKLSFHDTVRLLCQYGLVHTEVSQRQTSGSEGYGVHSCVHSWSTYVLNKEWDKSLTRLALTCVASEVPSTNADKWWLQQQRILQHAARCEYLIADSKVDIEGMDWELHNLGDLYTDQGELAEAKKMYIRVLQGKEKALGPDHISTLGTVNNLGNLYADQGKLAEAEKMYIRALQGMEKTLGPDHTSTLDTVHNLGELYSEQGKLAKAEKTFKRALQGCEAALGPNHISTLYTVCHLGNLYRLQHKLAQAEIMIRRALKGFEDALGPKHTSTLLAVYSLGLLYADQGKISEAETMYDRVLQGYEDALTPELVSSYIPALKTMFAFGDLFSRTDQKDMAKAMYNRALSGYRTVQGPSSKWCTIIEGRLQALQLTPHETEIQHKPTETGMPGTKSHIRDFSKPSNGASEDYRKKKRVSQRVSRLSLRPNREEGRRRSPRNQQPKTLSI